MAFAFDLTMYCTMRDIKMINGDVDDLKGEYFVHIYQNCMTKNFNWQKNSNILLEKQEGDKKRVIKRTLYFQQNVAVYCSTLYFNSQLVG